jgi:hypothetical protein
VTGYAFPYSQFQPVANVIDRFVFALPEALPARSVHRSKMRSLPRLKLALMILYVSMRDGVLLGETLERAYDRSNSSPAEMVTHRKWKM